MTPRGYLLYCAAALARADPQWLATWRPQLIDLVKDIANPDPQDPYFPLARHMDWYEGHSWAGGLTVFADAKNQVGGTGYGGKEGGGGGLKLLIVECGMLHGAWLSCCVLKGSCQQGGDSWQGYGTLARDAPPCCYCAMKQTSKGINTGFAPYAPLAGVHFRGGQRVLLAAHVCPGSW